MGLPATFTHNHPSSLSFASSVEHLASAFVWGRLDGRGGEPPPHPKGNQPRPAFAHDVADILDGHLVDPGATHPPAPLVGDITSEVMGEEMIASEPRLNAQLDLPPQV